jgi:hypothetical protein
MAQGEVSEVDILVQLAVLEAELVFTAKVQTEQVAQVGLAQHTHQLARLALDSREWQVRPILLLRQVMAAEDMAVEQEPILVAVVAAPAGRLAQFVLSGVLIDLIQIPIQQTYKAQK